MPNPLATSEAQPAPRDRRTHAQTQVATVKKMSSKTTVSDGCGSRIMWLLGMSLSESRHSPRATRLTVINRVRGIILAATPNDQAQAQPLWMASTCNDGNKISSKAQLQGGAAVAWSALLGDVCMGLNP